MADRVQGPTLRHYLFGCFAAGVFFGLGSGVFAYLGIGRGRIVRSGDLEHAATIALGVFVFCFVVGAVTSAVRMAKDRKGT